MSIKSNVINNSKPAKAAAKATRTARKTAHNKKSQHQTAAKNGKNNTKNNKSSTHILEGQKRQGCVFHTTTAARRPECGRRQTKKSRPRGVGFRRVGRKRRGGEKEACSRGISVGYQQIVSQLVEVKGLQSIVKKLLFTFWKVKQRGRRPPGGLHKQREAKNKHI